MARIKRWLMRAAVMAGAAFVTLALAEAALRGYGYYRGVVGGPGAGLTMPKEWERRPTTVPGAAQAFYWQGQLTVKNEYGMRRSEPFPAKQADRFRIMVVGDSLTFGPGVAVEDTYPAVLERELGRDYRVEVLNLGIGGYQTENILWVIKTFAPQLQPDLIVYGVCLNDFLPSRVGEYRGNAYPFPLPAAVKDFLIRSTLVGQIIAQGYNEFLIRLGLRRDFYGDILADLHGEQKKFEADVRAMSEFNRGLGLPPMVAMVLNQAPRTAGPPWQLAKLAESDLASAGMTVIPVDDYYRQHDRAIMAVSKWEPHPNAEAHRIFAEQLAKQIREMAAIAAYKKF
jgi:lysophospholipase L1-like esterase